MKYVPELKQKANRSNQFQHHRHVVVFEEAWILKRHLYGIVWNFKSMTLSFEDFIEIYLPVSIGEVILIVISPLLVDWIPEIQAQQKSNGINPC